jgi:hypothetical protein
MLDLSDYQDSLNSENLDTSGELHNSFEMKPES